MPDWPKCLTEAETLSKIVNGMSISRFGDGEFACAFGKGNATHKPNEKHAKELRDILETPAKNCLLAIPTMDPKGPKYNGWVRHKVRYYRLLNPNRIYASVFVGQSQSAPWILTKEYTEKFRGIWSGKQVTAVCPPTHGLIKLLQQDGADVTWVVCPRTEAYSAIDQLEVSCVNAGLKLVIISAGPMATVLANRLTYHGIQAIDIGRGAGVLLKFVP